jgi:predicted RNA-binding Zn-ribbon protein involved in translation (DUF1610 family)
VKQKNTSAIIALALLSAGLLSVLSGCYGIPKGTTELATVEQLQLKATGTGIVRANVKKTTYMTRCAVCGFQNVEKTILTPNPDNTYIRDWLCPNCGHNQIIMIQAFDKK